MSGDDGVRTVLLDACALIPIRLTVVLLGLAESGLFEVLWSETILDEVERNLPKAGISPEAAARRVDMMRTGFGAAAIVDDFDDLIQEMTCDAKDRHVLAAAVAGGATTLVTFNLKDFPEHSTVPYGVDVVHPDVFLCRLLAEATPGVLDGLDEIAGGLRTPATTTLGLLASLTSTVRSSPMKRPTHEPGAVVPPRQHRRWSCPRAPLRSTTLPNTPISPTQSMSP